MAKRVRRQTKRSSPIQMEYLEQRRLLTVATTTVLVPSAASIVFGNQVTFTATVTPSDNSHPTGTVTFDIGTVGLQTVNLSSNGTASFTTSTLPGGLDSMSATYAPTGEWQASTSTPITETVTVPTATSLSTSANTLTFGQAVTLTSVVTGTGGSPVGTVNFEIGTVSLGTQTLTNGTAVFITSALPSGTDMVTAAYAATNTFASSTSPAITESVTPFGTTTSLATSNSSAVFGSVVTLTATTTSTNGTFGGVVTFLDGTTTLGTGQVNTTTGKATLDDTINFLGTQSFTASFGGTNGFAASTSAGLSETGTPAATNTALNPSANPAHFGQLVTYSALVTSTTSGTPSGSVTFLDGATTLGHATVNSHGTAVITEMATGTLDLTAVFVSSTASFTGSTSSTLDETIIPETTTTTLTSSHNPATLNQSVTLTADVHAGFGSPGGSVTFLDGSTTLGVVALSSGSSHATLATTALPTGTLSLTAVYGGATDFATSTGTLTEIIKLPPTTTKLSSSTTKPAIGQSVTLSATVTSNSGSPTGTATFLDGLNTLGTANLNPTTHKATFIAMPNMITFGSNSIVAEYDGTTSFGTSDSSAVTVTLNPAKTTTTVTAAPNSITGGENATLTAMVTATTNSPTGSVTFVESGITLGSAALNTTTHKATLVVDYLQSGNDTITAVYPGATGFAASSGSTHETVGSIASVGTTTSLVQTGHVAQFGEPFTMSAVVSAITSGTLGGAVTFFAGSTELGQGLLNSGTGASETATFVSSSLPLGTQKIYAMYDGEAGFSTSTSSKSTVTVDPGGSTTTLVASNDTATFGVPVTLTASVTPSSPSNPGKVTFYDGSTVLGTSAVNGSTGSATFVVSNLPLGDNTLDASFNGVVGLTSSLAPSIDVTETTNTAVSLGFSATNVTVGQVVTLTATVTGTGGTPPGSVTFTSGGITLAPAVTLSNGVASIPDVVAFAGITATYTPSNSAFVTSTGTGNLTGTLPSPTTTLNVVTVNAGTTNAFTTSVPVEYGTVVAGTAGAVAAKSGSFVEVLYQGYLTNGTIFDQSSLHNNVPLDVGIDENAVVPGFNSALAGMLPGEERVVLISSDAGYQNVAQSGIPANSTLIFTIEMVNTNAPRLQVTNTNNNATVSNGAAASTSIGTSFGTLTVGQSSTSESFTLSNLDEEQGTALFDLALNGSVEISGANPGDFILTQPTGIAVSGNTPTSADTFTITFKPTGTGTRTATITIPTNDPDVPSFTFTVSGVGQ